MKKRSLLINSKLENLLIDSHETYYWIGFILADGNIRQDFLKLKIHLSIKDHDHLVKLANLVEFNGTIRIIEPRPNTNCNKQSHLDLHGKKNIKLISDKYNILPRKTYLGYNLNIIPYKYRLALIAGFIDGDGRITKQYKRKDSLLIIKIHNSWLEFLGQVASYIEGITNYKVKPPIINSCGYARLIISNNKCLKTIKQNCIDIQLPLMNRKWDVIE